MSLITDVLVQTCVLWTRKRNVGSGGRPRWDEPREISCRWTDKITLIVDDQGEERKSRSMIMVGEDLSLGDALALGELTTITDQREPMNNDGAGEIIGADKIPDFTADEFLRKVYL